MSLPELPYRLLLRRPQAERLRDAEPGRAGFAAPPAGRVAGLSVFPDKETGVTWGGRKPGSRTGKVIYCAAPNRRLPHSSL